MTPLDFAVRVTATYWDMIVTIKHPVMAGFEINVKETLATLSRLEPVGAIPTSSYSIGSNAQDVGSVQSPEGLMMRDFLSQLTRRMQ